VATELFRSFESPITNHESRPLRKLLEEAHIVFEERAQVADAVAQHREAFDAHAESEAGVALGIDVAGAQHVRMDHAATEYLERKGVDSPRVDAELLLSQALGLSRIELYTAFERPLTVA